MRATMAIRAWAWAGMMAVAGLLGGASMAHAQAPHDTMPIGVEATRVTIGATDFLPRCPERFDSLIVPASTVTTLPSDATYGCIEVHSGGRLRADRTRNTTTRFIDLIVLPGGMLDMGTVADPIACSIAVDLIVRDAPIDTAKDPFQWSHGLVNFGAQTRVGCEKTAFVRATSDLAAGASTITLDQVPIGWAVGDELLFPDTDMPDITKQGNDYTMRRESTVKIAAINGPTVTLSKGLDFAHHTILDVTGAMVLRPRVANLTRNIVIRSENPDGTPGHTADIGSGATWDIRYNRFADIGRTTVDPLNDTTVDPSDGHVMHVGTNERGRYAEHHHHVGSCPTCADVGNVLVGRGQFPTINRGSKGGLVLHNTSDTLVKDNVVIDFAGAGFVTEDGYEVRIRFLHNLAAYNFGHGFDVQGNVFDSAGNLARNCPFCDGTGFWLRGIVDMTFEGNEAWNNFISGVNFFNQQQPDSRYPSRPGGMPDTPLKHFEDQPLSVRDNVTAANLSSGLEIWGVKQFPYINWITAYNGGRQMFAINSDGIAMELQNPTMVCKPKAYIYSEGISASMGYVQHTDIVGGKIIGCAFGVGGGGGASYLNVTGGTILQNEVNFDMLPQVATIDGSGFRPLLDFPHKFIVLDNGLAGTVWPGPPTPLPRQGVSMWRSPRGSRMKLLNFQGHDYTLFYNQSLSQSPAWPSYQGDEHSSNTPVVGLTMQQSWDLYGIAFGGDVIKESDALTLDGLIFGVARAGLGTVLGPPRAVITSPTLRETAFAEGEPNDRRTGIYITLSGDPNAASRVVMITVDGDPPVAIDSDASALNDVRKFTTNHTGPGVHTVTAWRTTVADPTTKIAGSDTSTQFCVSNCPGESTGVEVPDVVGQAKQAAINELLAAGFTIGAVLDVASATVPIGSVVSQDPPAASHVVAGTQMVLFISAAIGPPPTCQPPQVLVNGQCVTPTTTQVPNLVGMTQAAATTAITGAHLVLGTVASSANPAPAGQVFSQVPGAGSTASIGSPVNLDISTGPTLPPIAPAGTYTYICDTAGNCKLVFVPKP